MKILYAGPMRDLEQALALVLGSEGLRYESCDDGEEVFDLATRYVYDAILIDDRLDDMVGRTVLLGLRQRKLPVPVIMLTDNRDSAWECRLLDQGADDVLHKPFQKTTLISRIRAVTRRWNGHAESKITIGATVLNLAEKTVCVDGKTIHLTGKEYHLLETLFLRAGSVMTKQHLMDAIYGGLDEPEMKIIDVFVCKVRAKIANAGGGEPIRTIWGRGYMVDTTPLPVAEPVEKAGAPDDGQTWREADVAELKSYIQKGFSASETASYMKRTRNAVISKADRMNWHFGKAIIDA